MARSSRSLPLGLISLAALLLLWAVSAWLAQSRALPNPLLVGQAIITEFQSGELMFHTGATLARVAAAFVVAMLIGSAIGILLGRSAALNTVFDPWVILFLNIPALVIIVLSYIWFGLNEAKVRSHLSRNLPKWPAYSGFQSGRHYVTLCYHNYNRILPQPPDQVLH